MQPADSYCEMGRKRGMQAGREEVMAAGEDPAEMHSALKNLPILGHLTTEELAQQAIALFKRAPLEKLLRHRDIEMHWCAPPQRTSTLYLGLPAVSASNSGNAEGTAVPCLEQPEHLHNIALCNVDCHLQSVRLVAWISGQWRPLPS